MQAHHPRLRFRSRPILQPDFVGWISRCSCQSTCPPTPTLKAEIFVVRRVRNGKMRHINLIRGEM